MPTITTTYNEEMTFESAIGRHRLLIDVPASMGGADRGPTPPELFVASLGSCVGAYVAAYCERIGLDATDLSVDVSYIKTGDPTRLDDIQVTVNLPHAEVTERQKAIRRVAEHCPVHESIATFSGIEFRLRDRSDLAVPVVVR